MKNLVHKSKKFVLPFAGGGVAYIISGVAMAGLIIFGAIFLIQHFISKKSKRKK